MLNEMIKYNRILRMFSNNLNVLLEFNLLLGNCDKETFIKKYTEIKSSCQFNL